MKYDTTVYKALTLFSQFTINMLVPVFLCSLVGYWLDNKLGTSFLFVVLFFVGALAGFRNSFLMAKQIYSGRKGDASCERKRSQNRSDS